MSDAFDENALMDRVDGDVEFLEETIAMLDEDSPALLNEIHAAVRSRDTANLAKAAHALKGMLANFCAEPAETAARDLETMGRKEQLSDVDASVARVKDETARLTEALHQFLRTKTE
jgi:HPt (histidine-containing phosphotransfer) domain-containing protein